MPGRGKRRRGRRRGQASGRQAWQGSRSGQPSQPADSSHSHASSSRSRSPLSRRQHIYDRARSSRPAAEGRRQEREDWRSQPPRTPERRPRRSRSRRARPGDESSRVEAAADPDRELDQMLAESESHTPGQGSEARPALASDAWMSTRSATPADATAPVADGPRSAPLRPPPPPPAVHAVARGGAVPLAVAVAAQAPVVEAPAAPTAPASRPAGTLALPAAGRLHLMRAMAQAGWVRLPDRGGSPFYIVPPTGATAML